ncbi:MAG: ComEC/Rec2 family competence protein, partial [Rhodothermales bacterium]
MPIPTPISLRACPALLGAVVFSTGIVLADRVGPSLWMWAVLLACAGILGGLIVGGRLISTRRFALTACAFLSLLAAGGLRHDSFFAIPSNHLLFSSIGENVRVAGRVVGTSVRTSRGYRFVLDVDSIAAGAITSHAAGRIQVSAFSADEEAAPASHLNACDRVLVRGELEQPSGARNPGDFDYEQYLRRRLIHLVIQTGDDDVSVLGSTAAGLECVAGELREGIRSRLQRHILDKAALGIVEALILGDRHGVDRETIQRFTRTGILHLLAVSGLHVIIVGMILYQLLRPALMRLGLSWRLVEILRTAATAALLLAYMMITGGSPSVVRAVVMTLLITGATTFQRTAHPLNTLGAAALVILAATPSHLFEPGFQLSFAAVGGIVTLAPRPKSSGPFQYVLSSVAVTAAAT